MRTLPALVLLLGLAACDAEPEPEPTAPVARVPEPRPRPDDDRPPRDDRPSTSGDPILDQFGGDAKGHADPLGDARRALRSDPREALRLLDAAQPAIDAGDDRGKRYDLRYFRGRAHQTLGAWQQAADAYRAAEKLDATDHRAIARLAEVLLKLEREDEAMPYLERYATLTEDPEERAKALAALAVLRNNAEVRKDQAAQAAGSGSTTDDKVIQALSSNPDKLRNPLDAAVAAYNARRYADARDRLDALLRDRPGDRKLLLIRARCHRNLKAYDKALADVNAVIAAAPDEAQAYTERAIIHVRRKAYAEAIRDYQRYLDRTSDATGAAQARSNIAQLRKLLR